MDIVQPYVEQTYRFIMLQSQTTPWLHISDLCTSLFAWSHYYSLQESSSTSPWVWVHRVGSTHTKGRTLTWSRAEIHSAGRWQRPPLHKPHSPTRTAFVGKQTLRSCFKLLATFKFLKGDTFCPSNLLTYHPSPNPRLHHSKHLLQPFANTSSFYHWFFISSVNTLPANAVESDSISYFKSVIKIIYLTWVSTM